MGRTKVFAGFVADKDDCDSSLGEGEPSLDEAETFGFNVPLCFAVYVDLRTSGGGGVVDHALAPAVVLREFTTALLAASPSTAI